MAIDPAQFKDDTRTPAEIAKAILDHEFIPRRDNAPKWTFREQWLYDIEETTHPKTTGVLLALKYIEDHVELSNIQKQNFTHALEVVDAYKKESETLRDSNHSQSRGEGFAQIYSDEVRRDNADHASDNSVEIMNCERIKPLVRQLARKLGIELIDPKRGAGF